MALLALVVLVDPALVTYVIRPEFARGWGAVVFGVGVNIWLIAIRWRRRRHQT
jgi:hypothetical protein